MPLRVCGPHVCRLSIYVILASEVWIGLVGLVNTLSLPHAVFLSAVFFRQLFRNGRCLGQFLRILAFRRIQLRVLIAIELSLPRDSHKGIGYT